MVVGYGIVLYRFYYSGGYCYGDFGCSFFVYVFVYYFVVDSLCSVVSFVYFDLFV